MKLIPFEVFHIETTFKKEQVKDRLNRKIGQKKANNFERTDQNWFFGSLKGDKFEIHPILDNKRNFWKPFLFGSIRGNETRTVISVIMRPSSASLILTAIFALTGYLTTEDALKIERNDVEIGLNFLSPLIAYIICTVAFQSDTDICKKHLLEITEGKLK